MRLRFYDVISCLKVLCSHLKYRTPFLNKIQAENIKQHSNRIPPAHLRWPFLLQNNLQMSALVGKWILKWTGDNHHMSLAGRGWVLMSPLQRGNWCCTREDCTVRSNVSWVMSHGTPYRHTDWLMEGHVWKHDLPAGGNHGYHGAKTSEYKYRRCNFYFLFLRKFLF